MATAQRTFIRVTDEDERHLDSVIIALDNNPQEPLRTWLKLYKHAIENAFIPDSWLRREVQL